MFVIESTACGRETEPTFALGMAKYTQRLAEAGSSGTVAFFVCMETGDEVLAFHTPTMDWGSEWFERFLVQLAEEKRDA